MRKRRTAERRNISAQPEVFRAADELARDAGHNNFSRVIQDLIVDAAIRLYGPRWRDRFEEDAKGEKAA